MDVVFEALSNLEAAMFKNQDGPRSPHFTPLTLTGNATFPALAGISLSEKMAVARQQAPRGSGVSWGIPFEIGEVVALQDQPVSVAVSPTTARWLVFLHVSDERPLEINPHGLTSPMRGRGQLAEHAADYVVRYADGSEVRAAIRRRHQVGAFTRGWGENCFECVAQHKVFPLRAAHGTPVMVMVDGSPMLAAADAVTILEQIEGAMAYLDTVGTRAEDRVYKRMRLVLESAHRTLHNRMHQAGHFHEHTLVTEYHSIE
jgi:hypothetical protein